VSDEALNSVKNQETIIIVASVVAIVFGLFNAMMVLRIKIQKDYDE
jgi:hypothetical protein